MKPKTFRILTLIWALMLGWFAASTIFAEMFTPVVGRASPYRTVYDPRSQRLQSSAATAAPLRGDIRGDYAMALAATVLNPGKHAATDEINPTRKKALEFTEQSLRLAPHSSDVWLTLASLHNLDTNQPRASVEALKMSYLTSPADAALIPTRLAILSASAAIGDVELQDLARGDIRLILTRRPDLKSSILGAYQRASADGKAYIRQAVLAIDPQFASALR
jgi:hypothetical protein